MSLKELGRALSGDFVMSKDVWTRLSSREKAVLIDALRSSRRGKLAGPGAVDTLISKLVQAKSYPQITVKVQGGLVQCVLGNPFPIRICDYDVERDEDPDVDECGEPCRIWLEPADPDVCPPAELDRSRSKNHSRSLKR
jgi:hypothetical protein